MSKQLKILTLALLLVFLVFFTPFWAAISLAAIFSLTIHPIVCKFNKKTRSKNVVKEKWAIGAVVITTLLILTPFGLGIYGAASRVISMSQNSDKDKPIDIAHIDKVMVKSAQGLSRVIKFQLSPDLEKNIKKTSQEMQTRVLDASKKAFLSIPDMTVHLLIFVLAFYIFLYYGTYIKEQILKFNLLKKDELNELIQVSQISCNHTLVSLLIIGTVQAAVVAGGAAIAKYDEILLIFIITFIFSFIPVIGAAPVAFILMLIELSQNNWKMGIFMLLIGAFAGTIDNIIKPLILNRGVPMDGALALIAIIGAILILGLPGLFIGPVIGSIAVYYFEKLSDLKNKKENI